MPSSTTKSTKKYPQDDSAHGSSPKHVPEPDRGLELLVLAGVRLQKYARDLAALLLWLLASLTLFGLTGASSGALLTAWANLLWQGFGWGAWLMPLTLALCGWAILARRLTAYRPIQWGRVFALEAAALALLGVLNVMIQGDDNVIRAAQGEGGGMIGWGIDFVLQRIFPPPTDAFVLGVMVLAGLFFGIPSTANRLARLGQWLRDYGFVGDRETAPDDSAPASSPITARSRPAVKPASQLKLAPKTTQKIPAGKRIHVQVEAADDEVKGKAKKRGKQLPGLDLLDNKDVRRPAQRDIDQAASIIVKTLEEFGVPVNVLGARVGPSVTQYQVEPGFVEKPGIDGMSKQWKVRVAQIASLKDDMALALSASTLRIEAPVPGQNYVGIEVPHQRNSVVSLRPVMEAEAFQKINSPLAVALGRDVSGAAVAADLGTMPHLLIAGTTGSGKSVCIVSMITCLATNNTPDDLRMVLIDPKMVELVRFNGLPHLFGKVETDLDRITGVLRWVTREMDRRYKLFEEFGARNLHNYNSKTAKQKDAERLPRVVVIIDELADLMMRAPDETERTVVRLAQMARATGIHLVVATQRPSTDIVTGLIKANFPARISFAVASGVDSRVILDGPGAESLLGKGDMLFLAPEVGTPMRLQGCFVNDREVDRIVTYWREQMEDEEPEPIEIPVEAPAEEATPTTTRAPWDTMLAREAAVEDKDNQIEEAIQIVKKYGTASASLLQRKMRIGYPRAARLMDELKEMGVIGREQTGVKTREVFVRGDDDPIGERAAKILGDDEDED